MSMEGELTVYCDQCAFGVWCTDTRGPALIQKPTRWMTKPRAIPTRLDRRCSSRGAPRRKHHRHCVLMSTAGKGGRVAGRYPTRLVDAVLRGLREELAACGALSFLEAGPHIDEPDVWAVHPEYYAEIYDTTSGVKLDPALVASARREEMEFLMNKMETWTYDSIDACMWAWARVTPRRRG